MGRLMEGEKGDTAKLMSGLLLAARGRRETRPGGANGGTHVVREGGEKRRGKEREGEACASEVVSVTT